MLVERDNFVFQIGRKFQLFRPRNLSPANIAGTLAFQSACMFLLTL